MIKRHPNQTEQRRVGRIKRIYPNLLSVTEESWENQIKTAENLAIVNVKSQKQLDTNNFRKLVG